MSRNEDSDTKERSLCANTCAISVLNPPCSATNTSVCASSPTTTLTLQASPSSFSLHALSERDQVASTGSLLSSDSYCKYAAVRINGIAGLALMDSGNTWRTVISREFAIQLGLDLQTDLRTLPNSKVGTAKENESLNVLGETKRHMHLSFANFPTRFKFRPVVLEGLAMPINISGPFMKRHGIDQIHSRDSIKIQGQEMPLLSSVPEPRLMEKSDLEIIIPKETIIPPCSNNYIDAQLVDIPEGQDPSRPGMVQGSLLFMNNTDLHPWVNALVSPSPTGHLKVGVMNTTGEPITIRAQTNYGNLTLACDSQQQTRYPWRIAVLKPKRVDEQKVKPQTETPSHTSFLAGPTTKENRQKRVNFLIKEFQLQDNALLGTTDLQLKAADLLLRFFEVFSFDGEFGTTNLIEHTIYTEPGPPINQRYRPINPSLEPQLKQQLDDWLKHDVIESSNSPYNFGLVAVPKKNGKTRWCVDFRPLNKISKRDTFPIGNIEDNLVRLSRSKVFSGIDGSGAFHVIPLSKQSKEKTAFATPFGSFQFKKLPFGLANGPATYARLVKIVLQGIPTSMALPYLDDTIIHSPDLDSHFQALEKVLVAHLKAGLKLQPSKCQLFRKEIDYLGHTVSENGISPMNSYLKIVQDWPLPVTRAQVRAFLGKVGYYRRFIKDFAAIAKPLTDKLVLDGTTDKEEFSPSPQFQEAFKNLRDRLITAPILAYPRFDSAEPFIVDTDWSQDNAAIGGVLSQKQNGIERVIAYGGHKLNHAQAHYGPPKGELYGVLYFLERWKYYLLHRPFLLRTDHLSLKYLESMTAPTGMIQRWLHTLAQYTFSIVHRAGKKHGNADGLSRAPHLVPEPSGPPDPILADEIVGALATIETWSHPFLKRKQNEDPCLQKIITFLKNPPEPNELKQCSPEVRFYMQLRPSLRLDANGLLRLELPKTLFNANRSVLVLPAALENEAIDRAHHQMAHRGIQATLDKLKNHAYFRSMKEKIKTRLNHCGSCQTKTTRLPDQKHTLYSHVPGYPFQVLSVDFVGPFPPSGPQRFRYLLTIKDTFTRWMEAFPLKDATAESVVRVLHKEIFCRYGKCERIHSDQGTQFTSTLTQTMSRLLKVEWTFTPAYNPKSNPVERTHRDLKSALMALTQAKPQEWVQYVPAILYAMRTSICQSTGFSPFQMMFGRNPIEDLDTFLPSPTHQHDLLTVSEYIQKQQNRLHQAFKLARDQMGLAVSRQRLQYNRTVRAFEKGNQVWLFTPILPSRQLPKFKTGWSGPWEVTKKINELVYEITLKNDVRNVQVVSIDRLRLYLESAFETSIDPPPGNLQLFGDEFAEYIPSGAPQTSPSAMSTPPSGPGGPGPGPAPPPPGGPPASGPIPSATLATKGGPSKSPTPPANLPAPGPSVVLPTGNQGGAQARGPTTRSTRPTSLQHSAISLPYQNLNDPDEVYDLDKTFSDSSLDFGHLRLPSSPPAKDYYNLNPALPSSPTFSRASSHSDDAYEPDPTPEPRRRPSLIPRLISRNDDFNVRASRRDRYTHRTGAPRDKTPDGMKKDLTRNEGEGQSVGTDLK